jgi:predicted  nucleic acid-binding Zn-ribbon protein
MEDFEPCPQCIEIGKCPRCGKVFEEGEDEWMMEGTNVCPVCGWNNEEAERQSRYPSQYIFDFVRVDHIHAIPQEPECYCMVEE